MSNPSLRLPRALDHTLTLAVALVRLAAAWMFFYALGQHAAQREHQVSDWCRAHPVECGLPTPTRTKE